MIDTWNAAAFFIKKLNVGSYNNVKNHLQTLMPSLWLLILSIGKAFFRLTALYVNFPLILI